LEEDNVHCPEAPVVVEGVTEENETEEKHRVCCWTKKIQEIARKKGGIGCPNWGGTKFSWQEPFLRPTSNEVGQGKG